MLEHMDVSTSHVKSIAYITHTHVCAHTPRAPPACERITSLFMFLDYDPGCGSLLADTATGHAGGLGGTSLRPARRREGPTAVRTTHTGHVIYGQIKSLISVQLPY